jgi:hypothetical protein
VFPYLSNEAVNDGVGAKVVNDAQGGQGRYDDDRSALNIVSNVLSHDLHFPCDLLYLSNIRA